MDVRRCGMQNKEEIRNQRMREGIGTLTVCMRVGVGV